MIDVSALRRLLLTVTSWLDGQEREIVAYLIEENRVLRRQVTAQGRRDRTQFSVSGAGTGHYGQEFIAAVQAELDAAATPLSAR